MGQLILLPALCEPVATAGKRGKKRASPPPPPSSPSSPRSPRPPSPPLLAPSALANEAAAAQSLPPAPDRQWSTSTSAAPSSASGVAVSQTACNDFRRSRKRAGSPTASCASGSAMSSFSWGSVGEGVGGGGSGATTSGHPKRRRPSGGIAVGGSRGWDSDDD